MKYLKEILLTGYQIINSNQFKACDKLIHHKTSTVAKHILSVTVKCLEISDYLESKNIKIDRTPNTCFSKS